MPLHVLTKTTLLENILVVENHVVAILVEPIDRDDSRVAMDRFASTSITHLSYPMVQEIVAIQR